jgi:hypothetical protein
MSPASRRSVALLTVTGATLTGDPTLKGSSCFSAGTHGIKRDRGRGRPRCRAQVPCAHHGANERMVVTQHGNIGIGAAAPDDSPAVSGASSDSGRATHRWQSDPEVP